LGEKINAYTALVRTPEGNRPLVGPTSERIILKPDVTKIG
jgi:hypothetical protein